MDKIRHGFDGRLSTEEIIKIIDDFKQEVLPEIEDKWRYSRGENPAILERQLPPTSPQNKVPTPYGRRITGLISSYMFLPGLISYNSDDQAYLESLLEIFDANDEPMETYRIGWQSTVYGVGYELFYTEGVGPTPTLTGEIGFSQVLPRFQRVPVAEIIPIYDYEIVPNLVAFIRFYAIQAEELEYVEVYYPDVRLDYQRKSRGNALLLIGEQSHGYDRPPLVVYENNDDLMGDFDSVVPLIDAYDVLMSDSMNEFDRFAQAYLVAKGFTITPEDTEKIKYQRAFSLLNNEDSIEFLTKPIEVEFIKHMQEQVRAEIHRGAGIPNLDDYKWGSSASGATIDKWIYLMELFSGIKEAYFRQGLTDRLEMLTGYGLNGDPDDVEIVMTRNDPDKSMLLAELLQKYSGHVSQRTLLEQFADFVTDVDAEMEAVKEEKEAMAELFDFGDNVEDEEDVPADADAE